MDIKDNQKSQIREARSEQRRIQTGLQKLENPGELLRINHLGVRILIFVLKIKMLHLNICNDYLNIMNRQGKS